MLVLGVFPAFAAAGTPTAVGTPTAAQRGASATPRTDGAAQRASADTAARSATPRTDNAAQRASADTAARSAAPAAVVSRSAAPQQRSIAARSAAPVSSRTTDNVARSALVARAATEDLTSGTRTGAAYEQCKSAYFACMDQFCAIKNQAYQRCSCSDRIYDLKNTQSVMQEASDKLTEFTESLDTVGMTAAQAAAMKKATEGESALTGDKSASKGLLNAILNSIKGEDANIGGRYEALNSINITINPDGSMGWIDGQVIASYNGGNLYTAVYGRCREAVRPDCTDASLQRAVTAYLMAVEQDCNTLQKMLNETKKKLAADTREGAAMLNLARVENRQKHNELDATSCLREVEAAIQSEQVCGPGYRKCLDNGQFIDVTTGKPFEGVVEFFKLASLLTFSDTVSIADQRLAQIPANRGFVLNFEKRTRQFAEPVLDKCTEKSDQVWADYLDKAMLDIHYAQNAKVQDIKNGCMDFVSVCYMGGERALSASMSMLMTDTLTNQPGFIEVTDKICNKYVQACNNMFQNTEAGGIIAQYVDTRKVEDLTMACRAVVQSCFDRFGGQGGRNFYEPKSGIFYEGRAFDWFSYKSIKCTDADHCPEDGPILSECARQLLNVESCNPEDNPAFAPGIFGGFVKYYIDGGDFWYANKAGVKGEIEYTGIATEVYYKVVDLLSVSCGNKYGYFKEKRFYDKAKHPYSPVNMCMSDFTSGIDEVYIYSAYKIGQLVSGVYDGIEDMCPKDYRNEVDVQSWGACNCWENGGRRSKNGKEGEEDMLDNSIGGNNTKCVPGVFQNKGSGPSAPVKTRGVLVSSDTADFNKVCPELSDGIYKTCPGFGYINKVPTYKGTPY